MLQLKDIYSTEHYKQIRDSFKKILIPYRKSRQVKLGSNMTLHFEDKQTIKYQILEMLYAEKHSSENDIMDELNAYNPLIPNGSNLKATLTIEFGDTTVRHQKLKELCGVEHKIYFKINDLENVYAIADEDLDRSKENKTSAVHFLRFEFTDMHIKEFTKKNSKVKIFIDHEFYSAETILTEDVKYDLGKDFK